MNPADVERLMSVAIATARVLGFGIAENCQTHLRTALQNARLTTAPVAKGAPVPPVLDVAGMLHLAEARVAIYVAAMASDAISNGVQPDGLLHEVNFKSVRKWICPLWPICK
jgi:hypothetical protein